MGIVDSLVSEVNTEEKTGPAISEKIAKALDSILSVGLNESVAAKRKEAIDRPQNCKLLTTTTSGSSNQFFPRVVTLPFQRQTHPLQRKLQLMLVAYQDRTRRGWHFDKSSRDHAQVMARGDPKTIQSVLTKMNIFL